jgi:hypothetical protein
MVGKKESIRQANAYRRRYRQAGRRQAGWGIGQVVADSRRRVITYRWGWENPPGNGRSIESLI